MKKMLRKLKRSNRFVRYFYYLVSIAYVIGLVFFIKNLLSLSGIENLLRGILISIFGAWFLFYFFSSFLNLMMRKYKPIILTSLLNIVFIALFFGASYFISTIYGGLKTMEEGNKTTYTSYLITLKDEKYDDKSIIGRINNEEDIEGYILTKNIINEHNLENEIKDFNDYDDLIYSLYEKKIALAFVPSNYVTLFKGNENLENIGSETEIVYQYTENIKSEDNTSSNKDFSEPLTFLIMGVDSTVDGLNPNAAFNGDTLMLVSFNPKTLNTLMVSVPRDTYVPIVCNNNRYAKINSAAAYGSECVVNTVGKLLDVDIDYYVKINFKGVVNLVEALHGVEVDVEAPTYGGSQYNGQMCEQNSDRQFGSHLVCIKPGLQTLNGEQALAYARNRHLYLGGDLDRIRHQQQVVEAVAKKLLNFSTFTDFKNIYSAISNNIATNMASEKILSGYNVLKEMALNALQGSEFININKATLETYSLPVYLPNSNRTTSAQGYYKDSLADVQKNIKIVLGQEEMEAIKTFEFSVNNDYEPAMAGKGLRKEKSLSTMPNLIGSSVSKAEEFCKANNIKLEKVYVDPGEQYYNGSVSPGLIGDQSVKIGTLVANITTLTIYIPNASSNKVDDSSNQSSNNTNNKDDGKQNSDKKTDNENEEKTEEEDEDTKDLKDNLNIF